MIVLLSSIPPFCSFSAQVNVSPYSAVMYRTVSSFPLLITPSEYSTKLPLFFLQKVDFGLKATSFLS